MACPGHPGRGPAKIRPFSRASNATEGSLSLGLGCRPCVCGFNIWRFPNTRGTFVGVPIIRIIVFGGVYRGPLFRETTI